MLAVLYFQKSLAFRSIIGNKKIYFPDCKIMLLLLDILIYSLLDPLYIRIRSSSLLPQAVGGGAAFYASASKRGGIFWAGALEP